MSSLLSHTSTRAPKNFDKEKTKEKTSELLEKIGDQQKMLFAQQQHSLLIVLQGLDASGKDGVISGVFQGLNPLGVNVQPFRAPTPEEKAHDFLWRVHPYTPARGMIHIFNRSHYEAVLAPRVNKVLEKKELDLRMRDINNFELLLRNNNTAILKFYLHVSREEQLERLNERKTNPEKFWKHHDEDWATRRKWDDYMDAYEDVFKHCNRPEWHIIPADQNWYKEFLVARKVLQTLQRMKLEYPKLRK